MENRFRTVSEEQHADEAEGRRTQRLEGVGAYIREQRRRARMSLRTLADAAGMSNPYLSQVERGLRRPSAQILQGIAKALRVSAETLYVQAGILEHTSTENEVLRAISRDPALSESQRRILAESYERFRIETAERRSRQGERRLRAAGGEEA